MPRAAVIIRKNVSVMISIIVAVARNGVIGDKNNMPWHISEDLRNFKRVTTGHPVVMGRNTFLSLGRPLPGRTNVVVSRTVKQIEGCRVAGSLDEAFALFGADEEVFVIGGAQVYAQTLEVADRFYLTRVEHDYEGDTLFPEWDRDKWRLVSAERHERGEKYPYPFVFEVYERIR